MSDCNEDTDGGQEFNQRSTPESPWSEFDEERRASARRYRDMRHSLGLAFRAAQEEAYVLWSAWQADLDEMERENEPS